MLATYCTNGECSELELAKEVPAELAAVEDFLRGLRRAHDRAGRGGSQRRRSCALMRRVWIPSPNYSGRGGSAVRLVVLHTAKGARTFEELGAFFSNPSSGVSSHTGIDDTPDTIGEYVAADMKSWTQGNANPYAVSAELCAFAEWSPAEWDRHPAMLINAAAWVAEECARFGIPVRALTAAQAQGGERGVCQHADLGAMGGGHWDCGPGFPMADVLALAGGKVPAHAAPGESEATDMVLTDPDTGGVWVADRTGAVFAYDGAPYAGGTNNAKVNAGGAPCVGIAAFADRAGPGYVLVLDFGAGAAGDRYRRYRFPRDGSAKV